MGNEGKVCEDEGAVFHGTGFSIEQKLSFNPMFHCEKLPKQVPENREKILFDRRPPSTLRPLQWGRILATSLVAEWWQPPKFWIKFIQRFQTQTSIGTQRRIYSRVWYHHNIHIGRTSGLYTIRGIFKN